MRRKRVIFHNNTDSTIWKYTCQKGNIFLSYMNSSYNTRNHETIAKIRKLNMSPIPNQTPKQVHYLNKDSIVYKSLILTAVPK